MCPRLGLCSLDHDQWIFLHLILASGCSKRCVFPGCLLFMTVLAELQTHSFKCIFNIKVSCPHFQESKSLQLCLLKHELISEKAHISVWNKCCFSSFCWYFILVERLANFMQPLWNVVMALLHLISHQGRNRPANFMILWTFSQRAEQDEKKPARWEKQVVSQTPFSNEAFRELIILDLTESTEVEMSRGGVITWWWWEPQPGRWAAQQEPGGQRPPQGGLGIQAPLPGRWRPRHREESSSWSEGQSRR